MVVDTGDPKVREHYKKTMKSMRREREKLFNKLSLDYIVVRTEEAANVTVRYRYTEYLTATGGACVAPDADGWIVATLPRPGEYRLTVDPAAVLLGTATDSRLCGSSGSPGSTNVVTSPATSTSMASG